MQSSMDQGVAFGALIGITVVLVILMILVVAAQGWRKLRLLIGMGVGLVFLIVIIIMGALDWPGTPNSCLFPATTPPVDTCYCENSPQIIRESGPVKQPINTLSAFAPVIAGLIVLGTIDVDRQRSGESLNFMTTVNHYSVGYGALVVFLGPGSMFFHASMTEWGGFLDQFSMVLLMTFVFMYSFYQVMGVYRWGFVRSMFGNSLWAFWLPYALLNTILGLVVILSGAGTAIFALWVGIVIVWELAVLLFEINGFSRDWKYLVWTLLAFVTAIFVWGWSQTGGPLCVPDSVYQGHAFWHILAMAVAPYLIFKYLRSELRARR
jgi:hypothetical protein